MDDSNYVQSSLPLINKDPNIFTNMNSTHQNENDLNKKSSSVSNEQPVQPNIAELLDKLTTCIPIINQPTSTQATALSSASAPQSSMIASNSESSVVQETAVKKLKNF
jgi:hypothetical protein